jgi:class 3 adenylate cyclase/pimeloyl-ACP methyl ester carboxylesterase
MERPVTRYAKRDGLHIAYQTVGGGPRDIVLVPNWITNLEAYWEFPEFPDFLNELTGYGRLIMFDQLGTGLSDRHAGRKTLESWAEDLNAVLKAVSSDRATILCFDASGAAGIFFAATYPHKVTGLVLTNCFARFFRDDDYPTGLPVDKRDQFLNAIESMWGGVTTLPAAAPTFAGDQALVAKWARLERNLLSPGEVRDVFAMQLDIDVRDVLSSITAPTLILHSKGNRYVRVQHGRYLADHIPNAKLVEIDSDHHFFWWGSGKQAYFAEIEEFITGTRADAAINRVLTTLLFTDIVDSTRHAAERGDQAWRDLLESHRDVVRRQLEHHRGREVDTRGDDFLAIFDGPARAIQCASAIIQGSRALGINIRAGLHTGEVELMGSGVAGIAVHIGARVCDLAASGEILVSGTVKDLVVGSKTEFDDRGAHALKGVPGEWRLFTVKS